MLCCVVLRRIHIGPTSLIICVQNYSNIYLTILTRYSLYYRHAATIPNLYSEINVTFYSVTLARTIWLPDDGPRTETCRSVFNVLMCKFYKCAVVGIIIE